MYWMLSLLKDDRKQHRCFGRRVHNPIVSSGPELLSNLIDYMHDVCLTPRLDKRRSLEHALMEETGAKRDLHFLWQECTQSFS